MTLIETSPLSNLKLTEQNDSEITAIHIKVTAHAYGIQTSFEAEYGSGGRVLTFNAEYDALPNLGHACGHNLIATASLGAFLATAAALKDSKKPGRLRLLGTPAEEAVGGKIKLIAAGAYSDVDACLMMHPTSSTVYPDGCLGDAFDKTLAISGFKVTFHGKSAHAAVAPDGINTLDAAVAGYNNISALRQQIQPDERIHVIILEGGKATNIIPSLAILEFGIRAPTLAQARALELRVQNCCRGAALATGCEITIDTLGFYADLRANLPLCQAYQDAIKGMGYMMQNSTTRATTLASTDQGNVSYECPSVQFILGIPSEGAFPHTAAFAKGAGSREGFEICLLASEGMAGTAYKFLTNDGFAREVKGAFDAQNKVV